MTTKLKYRLNLKDSHLDAIEYDDVNDITIKDGFLLIYAKGILEAMHAADNVLQLELVAGVVQLETQVIDEKELQQYTLDSLLLSNGVCIILIVEDS